MKTFSCPKLPHLWTLALNKFIIDVLRKGSTFTSVTLKCLTEANHSSQIGNHLTIRLRGCALLISQSAQLFLNINTFKIAHKIWQNISMNIVPNWCSEKPKLLRKTLFLCISRSQQCHQQQCPRMKTFCNPDSSNILTHPPFAWSWFRKPTFASMYPDPLLMLFFLRFPFIQPNAWPREPPDFFCPRWALASRARISEMSLGTRSPVDLLRDILEDLGATPQPRRVRPLLGGTVTSLTVAIPPVCQHRGAEGWARERMRWKIRKMRHITQTGTRKAEKEPSWKSLELTFPWFWTLSKNIYTRMSDMWFRSAKMGPSV